MDSIPNLIEKIQSVLKFQESQRRRKEAQGNLHAAKKHETTASNMQDVIEFLESLPHDENGSYTPSPPSKPDTNHSNTHDSDLFSFSESDLSELPESIVKTLNLTPSDELEGKIIELIKIAGRPLGVKELIIGLYKKYHYEVTERNPFASKLYRMVQADKLVSVPGKKGYYTLPCAGEVTLTLFEDAK